MLSYTASVTSWCVVNYANMWIVRWEQNFYSKALLAWKTRLRLSVWSLSSWFKKKKHCKAIVEPGSSWMQSWCIASYAMLAGCSLWAKLRKWCQHSPRCCGHCSLSLCATVPACICVKEIWKVNWDYRIKCPKETFVAPDPWPHTTHIHMRD